MTSVRAAQILSWVLEEPSPVTVLPQRLVGECARVLPVTGAGLALMTDDGHAGTVAVSDSAAAAMEDLQFSLGEGPCVECSRTGRPVLQPDLDRTGRARWPAFSAGALEAGIRATFAFPLRVGGIRVGVLDLHRDRVGELAPAELTESLAFADAATALLLHLQAQPSPDGSDVGAISVIEDHAEVHQATGAISVQAGVGVSEAFVRLRARAFATERPILDLAQDVLAGAVSFDPTYDGDGYGEQDGRSEHG